MSTTGDTKARVEKLGRVGTYLNTLLADDFYLIKGMDFEQQVTTIKNLFSKRGAMPAAAASMLLCENSIQLPMNSAHVVLLAQEAIRPTNYKEMISATKGYTRLQGSEELIRTNDFRAADERKKQYFKLKPCEGAVNKVAVSVSDVLDDMRREYTASEYASLDYYLPHFYNLYNDQVAAGLLYANTLVGLIPEPYAFVARMLRDPEGCKGLSTVIKSLGLNATRTGSLLCEGQNLLGRGTATLVLKDAVMPWVRPAPAGALIEGFSYDDIYNMCKSVYHDEIGDRPVLYDEPDTFWSKRWLWCVNGGHSRALEKSVPRWSVPRTGRVHRRVAMEHWRDNPIENWNGEVYVSASQKLEHGKTRLLNACDTVSYVAFERLLRPVEDMWKNSRVLLSPGTYGHEGMCKRIRDMTGKYNVMLDFDAFDTQHTLYAQQAAIHALCDYVGYEPHLSLQLINSFQTMHMNVGGEKVGIAQHGLMSGHRATMFLNSILNAVYMRLCCGKNWTRFDSMHTGDDIVMRCDSIALVGDIVKTMRAKGCRLNPTKQSIGTNCAEFLRMAVTATYGIGYVTRSIASFVEGNWVNTSALAPDDRLRSAITTARSITNRSCNTRVVKLLITSVNKYLSVKRQYVRALLLTEAGLDESPTFSNSFTYKNYKSKIQRNCSRIANELLTCDNQATTSYLAHHVTPIERDVLIHGGHSVRSSMLEASYAKSLADTADDRLAVFRLTPTPDRALRGWARSDVLLKRQRQRGRLEKFPILNLLKNVLTRRQVSEILQKLGYRTDGDPMVTAWGADAVGKNIRGVVSYSDAATYSGCTTVGVIYVIHPTHM